MKVFYHKKFDKHFDNLSFKLKSKVVAAIELFKKNPLDPILRNHALTAEMRHKRAISATGDVRIIFEEHNNYFLVIMLDVGTHNQVY